MKERFLQAWNHLRLRRFHPTSDVDIRTNPAVEPEEAGSTGAITTVTISVAIFIGDPRLAEVEAKGVV